MCSQQLNALNLRRMQEASETSRRTESWMQTILDTNRHHVITDNVHLFVARMGEL